MKIDIPSIFKNYNVIAGVTLANKDLFPPYGFSITKAEIFSDVEIMKMRTEFAQFIDINYENLIFQKQIHSDIVKVVDDNYTYGEHDGLITNIKSKILMLSLADCSGILIYDKELEVISAIHSGWRGTSKNIIGKAIEKFVNDFGSEPKNLLCYLSPSASVDNYEIGAELLDLLGEFSIKRGEKYFFDNKRMLTEQLLVQGVPAQNIEVSDVCTISNEQYHSYRRDKSQSGRMAAFIGMTQ